MFTGKDIILCQNSLEQQTEDDEGLIDCNHTNCFLLYEYCSKYSL